MDLHSFSIWNDYVQFLRGVEASGSFAENQKITAVRRVYQKAVLTPIIGIEILWKEYIQFENSINPIISEKMSLERSRDYMNARRVAKELEYTTKGLNRNLPAIPPTLTKEESKQVIHQLGLLATIFVLFKVFIFHFSIRTQVELWKKYISFEKSNPLRSEDTALVTRRVMFATEQCLLVLNHHPAVWHQAAQYLDQCSKLLTDKGVRIQCVLFLHWLFYNQSSEWCNLEIKNDLIAVIDALEQCKFSINGGLNESIYASKNDEEMSSAYYCGENEICRC